MAEKIIPPCRLCGKEITKRSFEKSGGRRRFCSRKCVSLYRTIAAAERGIKECAGCGSQFKAKSVEKTKYCSKACAVSSHKASPRECKNCGLLFTPLRWQKRTSRLISDGANVRDYCTAKCRQIFLRKGKEKRCAWCGVLFTPVRTDSISGYYRPYSLPTTCGSECSKSAYPISEERRKALSDRVSGSGHHYWQGGTHREGFRGHEWSNIAEKARNRAGRICQHCGKTEYENGRALDVHHKVPFHQFKRKQDANRRSNLEALCRSCHKKADLIWRAENPVQYSIGFR